MTVSAPLGYATHVAALGCVVTIACAAFAGSPSNAPPLPRDPTRVPRTPAEVKLHLEQTIIPEVDFRQASIKDVARFLSDRSNVNIVLRPEARKTRSTVSFKTRDMSAGQALRAVMKVTGLSYVIRGNVVIIGKRFGVLETRTYAIPQTSMNDARSVGVRRYLEDLGVPFPEGASAHYEFGNGKLLVRNTASSLDKLDRIVRALGGTRR